MHEAVTIGKEAPAKNMDTIFTQSQSTARTFSGTKDGTVRGGMQEEVARRGRGGTRSRGRSYYYFSCINLEHNGVAIGDCAAAPVGPVVDPREVHRSLVRRTSRLTRHPPSSRCPPGSSRGRCTVGPPRPRPSQRDFLFPVLPASPPPPPPEFLPAFSILPSSIKLPSKSVHCRSRLRRQLSSTDPYAGGSDPRGGRRPRHRRHSRGRCGRRIFPC